MWSILSIIPAVQWFPYYLYCCVNTRSRRVCDVRISQSRYNSVLLVQIALCLFEMAITIIHRLCFSHNRHLAFKYSSRILWLNVISRYARRCIFSISSRQRLKADTLASQWSVLSENNRHTRRCPTCFSTPFCYQHFAIRIDCNSPHSSLRMTPINGSFVANVAFIHYMKKAFILQYK
jgi:hypothetical protein